MLPKLHSCAFCRVMVAASEGVCGQVSTCRKGVVFKGRELNPLYIWYTEASSPTFYCGNCGPSGGSFVYIPPHAEGVTCALCDPSSPHAEFLRVVEGGRDADTMLEHVADVASSSKLLNQFRGCVPGVVQTAYETMAAAVPVAQVKIRTVFSGDAWPRPMTLTMFQVRDTEPGSPSAVHMLWARNRTPWMKATEPVQLCLFAHATLEDAMAAVRGQAGYISLGDLVRPDRAGAVVAADPKLMAATWSAWAVPPPAPFMVLAVPPPCRRPDLPLVAGCCLECGSVVAVAGADAAADAAAATDAHTRPDFFTCPLLSAPGAAFRRCRVGAPDCYFVCTRHSTCLSEGRDQLRVQPLGLHAEHVTCLFCDPEWPLAPLLRHVEAHSSTSTLLGAIKSRSMMPRFVDALVRETSTRPALLDRMTDAVHTMARAECIGDPAASAVFHDPDADRVHMMWRCWMTSDRKLVRLDSHLTVKEALALEVSAGFPWHPNGLAWPKSSVVPARLELMAAAISSDWAVCK